jgi:hypothetical protein
VAKSKIEVVGAYVDGHGPGSIIEVEENSAKYLVEIGYAKLVKKESAPKKPAAKAKSKSKKKDG